jgi:hypothetical protein
VGHYLGLEAIARRLGVSRNTVLARYERFGFLMYRRRVGPRWVWYTNDALITTWEVAKCRAERRSRVETRRQA